MRLFNQRMDENYLRFPDLKILYDENSSEGLTYGQLNEQSGRVYHYLKANHIGKEDFVLIRLPRGVCAAVAQIGVLKAGAAFVLGEEGMPPERLEYIRQDCSCKLEIHAGNWQEIMAQPFLAGHEDPDEHDAAFAIYTSGTTGNPKGVLHEYGNIDRDLIAQGATRAAFLEGKESAAIIPPLYFIAASSSILSRLYMGYVTYILSYATIKNSAALKQFFEEKRITFAFFSPSYVRTFGKELISVLKTLCVGSEPVNNLYIEGLTMFNSYSMSECGFLISIFQIDKPYDNCPVGRPLFDLKLKLVDENGEEAAPGDAGEVCVEDPYVRGYINLPEQTARAFVDGFYHTGDIGKMDENGNLVLLGRNDDMIKINGNRIEPAEIEAAVREVTGLSWVAAKGFSEAGRAFICVYYTDQVSIDPKEIRKALSGRLPNYMIPAYFVKLDQLPLNQNGKLDRRKLTIPEIAAFQREYAEPATETERAICSGMERVLKLEQVGVHDDFFMIGGDSIKAISLAGLCREMGLSVETIFQGRTPREIAALLESSRATRPVRKGEKRADGCSVLTPSECGMYLEQRMAPDSTEYNLNIGIIVRGASPEALEAALTTILKKHEAFHSRYGEEQGVPMRILTDTLPEIVWKEAGSREEVQHIVSSDCVPFDLSKVPVRITAYSLPDGEIVVHLAIHHIAFDGGSASILAEELYQLLKGESIGAAGIDLSDLSCVDYTAQYEKGRKYYQEMFADGVPSNEMPVEVVRPEVLPATNAMVSFRLEGSEVGLLDTAARRQEVTAFEFLFAAVSMTLGKYCSSEDVVIAIPSNMRDQDSRNVIGMFVNTAPVRVKPVHAKDLGAYLQEVSEAIRAVTRNCSLPFSEIVKEFCQERDPSRSPICDVMVNYLPPVEKQEEGEVGVELFAPLQQIRRDMVITIHKDADAVGFTLQYARELFSEALVSSFIQQLKHTISLMCSQASGTVGDALMLPEEQLRLLDSFNANERDYEHTDIVTLFRRAAKNYPDHLAAVYQDRKLTYRQVDEITERIGSYIRSLGISREDVVSVLIPRCEYMVLASVGVLKSGAAYQPLDPSYPTERLEFMIHDAGAKLLIADKGLMERVPNYDGPVLYLEDIPALPDGGVIAENPRPEDLFILLYTSGSTGTPKGVMLEHGGLAAFVSWYRRYYGLNADSAVAAYASYGFDADMMDLYPALTTGAAVHIIPEEMRLDFKKIQEYFEENRITHAFMTTQVGRQFADYYTGSSLKHLSVGGEKLAPVFPENKSFRFYNGYGPTECTIFTTIAPVLRLYKRVPIGGALDNMKLYVVDKDGNRLPPYVAGELWVAGHQVGRGYLNRPEKTAESFIPNPFTKQAGYERIYRTGDIVRFLPDGSIDFVGRNDGQVKVRGFRIELTEVEEIIRRFPGIKDVTVQAFDAPSGGKYIAAYIVADEQIDIDRLNAFIAENKPPYMVPAATMQIEKIPLNQNQKVNKRALPEPVLHVQESTQELSRPCTKFEEKILEVVKSVIGDVDIGLSASLVNCGLTSINAISLVSKLSDTFMTELPVMKLLDGASIIDIENMIFEAWMAGGLKGNAGAAEAPKAALKEAYPLTPVQLGVYYDAMKRKADTLYNIPLCYAFEGISARRLADSVKAAVKAHAYLNTHFEIRDGAFVQIRNDQMEAAVSCVEMRDEAFQAYKDGFVRPFNLQTGPLYRFEIVETEKKVYLLWDIHHLIFDGFSSGVLLKDIISAYQGESLAPERYTYFDYADEEEARKDSEEYRQAGAYFEQMFKNFESASEIPVNQAGNMEDGVLGEVFRSIPKASVDRFCKEVEITPASYFLAAVFYTVSRFANTRQVYLSTIDSGRNSAKTASCLGMFVHTLPLYMNFEEKLSVLELVQRANEGMRGSIKNEIYPFAEIATKYGFRTDIMYECQLGVTNAEGSLGGIAYESVRLKLDAPKFKVAFAIYENDTEYVLSVRYNDALYTEEYMHVLADSLKTVSETMLLDQQRLVSGISLMDSREKQRIDGFGSIKKCALPYRLLHHALEAAAQKHPNREALIACDQTLTFRELNEEANTVAWRLIEKGIQRGDSIVLLLPRRSFYFAAAFGVLKTGAAFIPCDPEYPVDRIQHIISDAEAKYLITTEAHLADYPADQVLDITELLRGDRKENPDVEMNPEDLAYMIYTSGSTGKPKGVELRHIGICNYINPDEDSLFFHYVAEKLERIVSVTTISFDMSFKDTVGILCNGKTVVFTDEEQMNDPRALSEILIASGADAFSATPSRLLQYMEYAPFKEALSKCSLVICGGEAYPKTLLNQLRELGIANLYNSYGPTEITVSSNMADLTRAEHISVGRPLPNYQEYIVDADGNPVPHGVIGELLIGGPGVARGYHKLPEMTAKNFVEYNGQRVYRSGDYARWDAEGNVQILGRLDNQVKLRGLRIELGEIEGLIEKQPGIKKAVVTIRKISGQENLCAYFTADRQIDIPQLKEELKKHLTHYMVPTAYLQMEAIPVSPNGKTNLKALPEPVAAEAGEYAAPQNDVEKCFCQIFQEVLKVERTGAEDDFFQSGGTSLTVTSVVIKASEEGYALNYGDVFKHTTPRALAKLFLADSPKETAADTDSLEDYDYSAINAVLQRNTLSALSAGEKREIGNILLTGATGYMGVHVLAEYLRSEHGKAYCLVRKGKFDNPKKRLTNILFYYFGSEFSTAMEERIEVFNGDVTSYDSFEPLKQLPIDTVFNCAASVKHFSSGTDIEDINVGGAANCVRFCEETGARLIHFSTTSISGTMVASSQHAGRVLNEQSLYFGQQLDNQYSHAKLLSERVVLEAVAQRGLDGKVIRVGTLAARASDGEFQMNFLTNSFVGRLRSYVVLKCFPYAMMSLPLRMGPIDVSAKAFLLLARTPKECVVFNAINNRSIPTASVIRVMQRVGMDIRFVENDQFNAAVLEAQKDPRKAAILQSMLAYTNLGGGVSAFPVQVDCEYTTQVLARMGFFWIETGEDYVQRFIEALAGLGFFDETNLNR
ncbi:MAG: amino acid adenylation domain-containing protein [Aristaeellaceae bacterium]